MTSNASFYPPIIPEPDLEDDSINEWAITVKDAVNIIDNIKLKSVAPADHTKIVNIYLDSNNSIIVETE